LALERDSYTARDVPRFNYDFIVPGAFAQYDLTVSPKFSLSGSARVDHHSEYGTFFSPRVSGLARAGDWTSRLSVGTGFFGPTPLTEETEAAGLTRLEIRRPVEAERGLSTSFDVSRTDGPLSYTATLFASRIRDPLHVERSPSYVLSTLPDPTTNVGLELLGTWRRAPLSVTASYTYVRARETVDAVEQDVPLTPRHSAGLVATIEQHERSRLGLELYYTGRQTLEDNPYRPVSRPYVVVGVLGERAFDTRVGVLRVFVNLENLGNVRQTRFDPLRLPARGSGGRWATDAWTELTGFTSNAGIRVAF
jgi:iron complex outermembrane receptor protein